MSNTEFAAVFAEQFGKITLNTEQFGNKVCAPTLKIISSYYNVKAFLDSSSLYFINGDDVMLLACVKTVVAASDLCEDIVRFDIICGVGETARYSMLALRK